VTDPENTVNKLIDALHAICEREGHGWATSPLGGEYCQACGETRPTPIGASVAFLEDFLAVKVEVHSSPERDSDGAPLHEDFIVLDRSMWEALREDAQAALDAAKENTP